MVLGKFLATSHLRPGWPCPAPRAPALKFHSHWPPVPQHHATMPQCHHADSNAIFALPVAASLAVAVAVGNHCRLLLGAIPPMPPPRAIDSYGRVRHPVISPFPLLRIQRVGNLLTLHWQRKLIKNESRRCRRPPASR